uniref:Protein kinase domain-containing protein n=2 Tax=Ciona intestinalis TaxID=7719 RepID=H2Y1Z4_CIOIN
MEETRSAETEEIVKKDTIDEIPILQNDQLIQLKVIGSGGFGEVLLCCYRKEGNQMPAKYVVKKQLLRGGLRTRDYKYLKNEAKILWRLESPFVIKMEGLSFSNNQFSIVVEYAENGSCADFFRRLFYDRENKDLVSALWPLKTRIAYQVINGMAYLHGVQPRRILHLDLKSQNVLLDQDLNVKLCDFGLSQMHTLSVLSRASTFTAKDGENNGGIRGTYSHIAPECFKNPNLK